MVAGQTAAIKWSPVQDTSVDGERRWREERETTSLGNEKMTKKTSSTDVDYEAQSSAVKDPARRRGQRKKIEGTEKNNYRVKSSTMSKRRSPLSQPLSKFLLLF